MTAVGEFVSQTGMRHRVKMYGTGFVIGVCGQKLRDFGVAQGRVQDYRRCFPVVSPDFSSDSANEIRVLTERLVRLTDAVSGLVAAGCTWDRDKPCAKHRDQVDWCTRCTIAAALESGERA